MAAAPLAELLEPALECLFSTDTSFRDPTAKYVGLENLAILEVWSFSDTEWPDFINDILPPEQIRSWVDKEAPVKDGKKPLASLKMLIGTRKERDRAFQPTNEDINLANSMQHLSRTFRLPTAYLDSMLFARFLSYEGLELDPDLSTISSYKAGFGESSIAWSFDPITNSSRAVLTFHDGTNDDERANFIRCLYRSRALADQALFLPYVKAIFCFTKLSAMVHQAARRGSALESDIKYCFENPDDLVAYKALMSVSNRNAYNAGVMASCQESLEVVRQVTTYFFNKDRLSYTSSESLKGSFSYQKGDFLKACLRNIDQRATARLADAAKCQQRSTRQVTLIMGVQAQRNQNISLEISRSSEQIATESRRDQALSVQIARASTTIALESRRDASSMKTIAAVTMSFLPGTFVSSCFAMPLFNWDGRGGGGVVNPRIWVYWAVTIPLTLLTFFVWWAWFRYRNKREIAAKVEGLEDIAVGESGN